MLRPCYFNTTALYGLVAPHSSSLESSTDLSILTYINNIAQEALYATPEPVTKDFLLSCYTYVFMYNGRPSMLLFSKEYGKYCLMIDDPDLYGVHSTDAIYAFVQDNIPYLVNSEGFYNILTGEQINSSVDTHIFDKITNQNKISDVRVLTDEGTTVIGMYKDSNAEIITYKVNISINSGITGEWKTYSSTNQETVLSGAWLIRFDNSLLLFWLSPKTVAVPQITYSGTQLFNGLRYRGDYNVGNEVIGYTLAQLYINGIRTPFRKYNPDTGVWERLDNFFGEE